MSASLRSLRGSLTVEAVRAAFADAAAWGEADPWTL